jgi:hypothetical protein
MLENWALSQDNLLRFSIKKYGTDKWSKISTLFSFKSKKNCCYRWKNWIDEKFKKFDWTKNEDKLIFFFKRVFSDQWKLLSDFLHRNRLQCIYRIKLLLHFRDKIKKKLRFYNNEKKNYSKNAMKKKEKIFVFQKILNLKLRLLNSFGKKLFKKAKIRILFKRKNFFGFPDILGIPNLSKISEFERCNVKKQLFLK